MPPILTLSILPETFAVCRLAKDTVVPEWASSGELVSITRTRDELSIICPNANVPKGIQAETNWRCFKIAGPIDFALIGILAALVTPLAHAGISIFAISTYDTDYLMVRSESLDHAIHVLKLAGHQVV
ncbi:MAG: ACT domain-containing protein [Chloroflexota bacterium]